jgi:hypothetical protein
MEEEENQAGEIVEEDQALMEEEGEKEALRKEKVNERSRKWRAKNLEKTREYSRNWYQNNKEKAREYSKRARDKKRAAKNEAVE